MTSDETIRKVAERLHSSYCECEGWHEECQGPHGGDRRVARRLYEDGLLAPAQLREEWGKRGLGRRWRTHTRPSFNEHDARNVDWDETTVRRYATDWEEA